VILTSIGIVHGKPSPLSHTLTPNRWREVKRFDNDSVSIPFLDTMFITIKRKDSFQYHNKDAFIYNGIYILDGKDLDFGYAKFTIMFKKQTSMLLRDGKGYYLFNIDSSDTLKTIVLPKDEKIDSNLTIDNMIGKWSFYKRTAVKQVSTFDHSQMIKTVLITGKSSSGKLGFVFSDLDKTDDPSWSIVRFNKNMTLECEGKSKRILTVTKCQGGELILEDEELRYFFKQFR